MDQSCHAKTLFLGFYHMGSPCVSNISHRLTRMFDANSLASCMCEKGLSMVNSVCLWYFCKLTESV